MTISVILRLLNDALSEGRLCGQAEVVETGATIRFGSFEEMLAFLQRAATGIAPAPADAGRAPRANDQPGGSRR